MGLQANQAVHHVNAGFFQGLRPCDVGLLVETGLELHQRRYLFALLGGPDETVDDGAVS